MSKGKKRLEYQHQVGAEGQSLVLIVTQVHEDSQSIRARSRLVGSRAGGGCLDIGDIRARMTVLEGDSHRDG